ncbi:MarR family winged helix-turn-helix transcriptional regulator [Paenibacillus sp. GCM10028914]|uniref:MarR family winged helix-turn-helix transcriptional regulator n=1 Tax=Paenibacillus sp. GCM10028914 TaxID=3273416 RepID=UPI003605B343
MPTRSNLTEFEELYLEFQRKVSAEWHKRMDSLVSGSQATILWKLELSGPQKASTLAAQMNVTPGAITSLSDKLISSGYAIRNRDLHDRRIVYLEITDQGREVLKQFRIETKSIMEDFFTGISEEDINHLIRIYQQVLLNIDK